MRWRKLGRVYCPDGTQPWAQTHAMIPTPIRLDANTIRVFITSCDAEGIGRVGFVDVDSHDPTRIVHIGQKPVLDIGLDGTFDENGVLVCSAINTPDHQTFMYYAGFELGTKIRYRLLTGLAVAPQGTTAFQRIKRTPVLERSDQELFFRGGPFAIYDEQKFKMWYVAGSQWEVLGNQTKPVYDVRYIESQDGIHWPEQGVPCIQIEHQNEHGFGRPYVIYHDGKYRMFYSIRRRDLRSYRLGYAESTDGLSWIRKDEEIGITVSEQGWDSSMICYSAVMELGGQFYMFYNGNDFGKSGFGVAILERW